MKKVLILLVIALNSGILFSLDLVIALEVLKMEKKPPSWM
jgi:hypothetical protein